MTLFLPIEKPFVLQMLKSIPLTWKKTEPKEVVHYASKRAAVYSDVPVTKTVCIAMNFSL